VIKSEFPLSILDRRTPIQFVDKTQTVKRKIRNATPTAKNLLYILALGSYAVQGC
jgi:hypothetical protein